MEGLLHHGDCHVLQISIFKCLTMLLTSLDLVPRVRPSHWPLTFEMCLTWFSLDVSFFDFPARNILEGLVIVFKITTCPGLDFDSPPTFTPTHRYYRYDYDYDDERHNPSSKVHVRP